VCERLSIGEYARRAGLSISAVRFYGDRGLLVPASVDPGTGYRSYDEAQVAAGRMIGDLRRLRLSLADVATFLAARSDDRPALLARHLGALEAHLHDARAVAHTLLTEHPRSETSMARVTLPAPTLGAALDQVLPAVSRDPEEPVLGCVLVEARGGSLRLVATDRYRLAVRDLVPETGGDQEFRGLVPAATLRRWRPDLPSEGSLTLAVSADDLAIRADCLDLACPLVPAEFPAYEAVLACDAGARAVVVGREALRAGLSRVADQGDVVLVRASRDGVTLVRGDEEVTVPARGVGAVVEVALDPAFAVDAVEAVSGPDVVVEIADALHPVVFRSADDGTFTTLLMPVHVA